MMSTGSRISLVECAHVLGALRLRVRRAAESGWEEVESLHQNLLTTVGKNNLRDFFLRRGLEPVSIAFGTGNGDGTAAAAAAGDTVLQVERFRKQILRTTSASLVAVLQTLVLASEANNTPAWKFSEAGLFTSSAANEGTLISRVTFPFITKDNLTQITAEWELTII